MAENIVEKIEKHVQGASGNETLDKTVVNYTGLQRYHHQLLYKLGLVQDTAEYKYDGERWIDADGKLVAKGTEGATPEFTEKVLSKAVDNIYDLAKNGSVKFSDGFATAPEGEDPYEVVSFVEDEVATGNLYYINAKCGDKTVNIKLDASAFVKDSVLESVFILTVEENEGTLAYKANGKEAELDLENETLNVAGETVFHVDVKDLAEKEAGTYFYYTWKVDNGEPATEDDKAIAYQYTCIAVKEIYGDIQTDEYLSFDPETTKISANTGEIKATTKEGTGEVVDYIYEIKSETDPVSNTVVIYSIVGDDEKGEEVAQAPIEGEVSADSIKAAIEAAGFDAPENPTADGGTCSRVEGGKKEWSGDENTLATTENVAEVAQEIQDDLDNLKDTVSALEDKVDELEEKIEDLESSDIVVDDVVYTTDSVTKLTVSKEESAEGKTTTHIGLQISLVSDDDITSLFVTDAVVTDDNVETINAMSADAKASTNVSFDDADNAVKVLDEDNTKSAEPFNDITIDGGNN